MPALFVCASAAAQVAGRIEGIVSDSDGRPLEGVEVRASGPRLPGVRLAVTDANGWYRLLELPPGEYLVVFRLPGLSPRQRRVAVSLDDSSALDLVLELAAAETIAVSGESRSVDALSTTGTSYPGVLVARLPVARNYADVVRSNPGVSADKGETQGRSLALTIYGATSVENQWVIDGINTTNVQKGFQGKAINGEFVEEIEVKSGGYQAEYGGAMGAVVNVVTRSGGNDLRGGAFVFYDSSAMRAEQVVIDGVDSPIGMKITPSERRDYGAQLGGAIVRDHLWFFGAYNRVDTPGTTSRYFDGDAVPAAMRFPYDTVDDLYSAKFDAALGAGTSIVATVFGDPSTVTGAALVGTGLPVTSLIESPDPGTWESRRELGGVDYGLRFSQILGAAALLAAQASHHQDRFELFPFGAGRAVRIEDWTCDGGTPEKPCGIPDGPNSASGGLGLIDGNTQRNSSDRIQVRGDATLYLGSHELKAGGGYQNGRTTAVSSYTGGQLVGAYDEYGQLYYRHDFFVVSATDPVPTDQTGRASTVEKSAFLQDIWRASRSLTISAGLRWDQQDLRADGRSKIKTTAGWQPRLGIVWNPRGDGRSKVYAFAGRFSYEMPTDLTIQAFGAGVSVATFNFDPVDRTPDSGVVGHSTIVSPFGHGELVDVGIKGAYQDELTVGVEKLFDPSLSVGLKATYRQLGRFIEDRCDLDPDSPENGGFSCAFMNPGSSGRYARGDFQACNGLDPGYGYECGLPGVAAPNARRIYRGVEILARKSVSSRFWIQASYAYSSLRGNIDGGVNENFGMGQTDPGWNADFDYPQFSRDADGRLFLDRPHQARLDAVYTVPFGLFVGVGAYAQSGSPTNKRGYFNEIYGGANIFLVPRGEAGRMPTLWEANLTAGYPLVLGPVTVTIQAFLYSVFNNQFRTNESFAWTAVTPPDGYPDSLYDPNVPSNTGVYGKALARQQPRLFRASLRVSF